MRSVARLVKRRFVDAYWTFRGPRIWLPPMPANPRSVLFVCKGNICRSPFAERVAQRIAVERGSGQMVFGSAGVRVSCPESSPEDAVRAAARFGLDLKSHRSQPLTPQLSKAWDMIIVMEVWQLEAIRKVELGIRDRVFLLASMEEPRAQAAVGYTAMNIEDPYGGSDSAYDLCFNRIQRSVSGLLERLRAMEQLMEY